MPTSETSEIVSFRSIWLFRTTQNSRKKYDVIHSATLLLLCSFLLKDVVLI